MARIGKHKAKYDRYKNSGNKEKNKVAKKIRHDKRMARFAERRESGKTYVYSKEKADAKLKKAYGGYNLDKLSKDEIAELKNNFNKPNKGSNRGSDTPLAKQTSEMRKLNNLLKKMEEENKKKRKSNSNKNS